MVLFLFDDTIKEYQGLGLMGSFSGVIRIENVLSLFCDTPFNLAPEKLFEKTMAPFSNGKFPFHCFCIGLEVVSMGLISPCP